MTANILMAFRRVENGYILELGADHPGLMGKTHVAVSADDLRTAAHEVFEQELDRVLSAINQKK